MQLSSSNRLEREKERSSAKRSSSASASKPGAVSSTDGRDRRKSSSHSKSGKSRASSAGSSTTRGPRPSDAKIFNQAPTAPNRGPSLTTSSLAKDDDMETGLAAEAVNYSQITTTANALREKNREVEALRQELQRTREEQASKSRSAFWCKVCLGSLILIGGIVGAVIYLTRDGGGSGEAGINSTPPAIPNPIDDSTSEPTAQVSTTVVPTDSPTASPEDGQSVFHRPSLETCSKISEGRPVDGQEDMIRQPMSINMNVYLLVDIRSELWLPEMLQNFQELVMPSVVGCRNTTLDVYAVGNAKIDQDNVATIIMVPCEDQANGPCYTIELQVNLFMKKDIVSYDLNDLNQLVEEAFQTIIDLVLNAQGENYMAIKAIGSLTVVALTTSPSQEPSSKHIVTEISPTTSPSFQPTTMMPSGVTTASPTPLPSPSPTVAPPTPSPAPGPTQPPTQEPTFSPTPSPTPGPTPISSTLPTISFSPSSSPSATPTQNVGLGCPGSSTRAFIPTSAGLLADGWQLVAWARGVGRMFNGNTDLDPTASFGAAPADLVNISPDQPDFQIPFEDLLSPDGNEILFITGDHTRWGYMEFESAFPLQAVFPFTEFEPNAEFTMCAGDNTGINLNCGSILFRPNVPEDPWISMANGGHFEGYNQDLMIWGENNYGNTGSNLKNAHGGMKVLVRPRKAPLAVDRTNFSGICVQHVGLGCPGSSTRAFVPTSAGLQADGWQLVAWAQGVGGMFNGNTDLDPTASYGTAPTDLVNISPDQSDFQIAYKDRLSSDGNEILFITGDHTRWGYMEFESAFPLQFVAPFELNAAFTTCAGDNTGIHLNCGSILYRPFPTEDPWISIANGGHFEGYDHDLMVWGESNYGNTGSSLKNEHGGMKVLVRPRKAPLAVDRTNFSGTCVQHVGLGCPGSSTRAFIPTSAGLQADGWQLVAWAQGVGGMFNGNTDLDPTASHGTAPTDLINISPDQPDFQIAYQDLLSSDGNEILFITGDHTRWGYMEFESAFPLQAVFPFTTLEPNAEFTMCAGDNTGINLNCGSILFRPNVPEDPWISMANGGHVEGYNQDLMIWGDNNYDNTGSNLKNEHGGMKVLVRPRKAPLAADRINFSGTCPASTISP